MITTKMRMLNKLRTLLLLFVLLFSSYVSYSQVELPRFVCPDQTQSSFIYDGIKAKKSDGVCNSGSKVRGDISGNTDMVASYEVIRRDGGPHRVEIKINWVPGKTGVVTIDVYYQKKRHTGWGDCDWYDWAYMYTYRISRLTVNPGGTLTGITSIKSTDDQGVRPFTFFYTPSSTYPSGLRVAELRYHNGEKMVQSSVVGFLGLYIPALVVYNAKGFGTFVLNVEAKDACGNWYPAVSKTITVFPSCYQDNPSLVNTPIKGPGLISYPEGYQVDKDATYQVAVEGISNFASHYVWNVADGGSQDVSFDNGNFSVHSGLGSYRLEAVKKPGRELCPAIDALKVFVGGKDITLEQTCSIVLPEDFPDFGYPYKPGDSFLQHFAAHVITKRSIVVMPGVTLDHGAELFINIPEPGPDPEDPDKSLNYIEKTGYDEYGRVASASRSYFDQRGKALQMQYKNLSADVVLANATVYDAYERPAITTLSAPVQAGTLQTEPDECGEEPDHEIGAAGAFAYRSDFITGPNNSRYTYANFDGTGESDIGNKENSPDPVNASVEGTLGWYYSTNNGTSTEAKLNEPLVATTQYPYSRVLYHHDGSGEAKGATRPGDVFRAGSGIIATSDKEDVEDGDPYLADYLGMRQRELNLSFNAPSITKEFFKAVAFDEDGNKSVAYTDKSGKAVMALYFGKQLNPITKSYQFYDYAGRILVSVTPNGVAGYRVAGSKSNFEDIDKTRYYYNHKGLLVKLEEADAGTTEYVYRRDGKIRFSQSAKQREQNPKSYSYVQYDRSGRPVELGEYVPGTNGIAFNSTDMTLPSTLESISSDGGLDDEKGEKRYRTQTLYDEICENKEVSDEGGANENAGLPADRKQRFVHGAVSRTKRDGQITTWYSYDERGRVEWMVQDINGLGVKTIDYRYDPIGGVQEIIYQKEEDDQFSHYYTYDKDGRMLNAYTTTKSLQYNIKGDLTNPEVLLLQATYYYYLHGPLKRVELAGDLQGIDYVYTVHGSLKSINHADPVRDPGKDGAENTFKPDVFGMTLDYYNGDYVGAGYNTGNPTIPDQYKQQFSGNVRAFRWHSPVEPDAQHGYAFQYDERSQLTTADWAGVTGDLFTVNALGSYHEGVSKYDNNGNIKALNRKDNLGINAADFEYHYPENSNQLAQITQGNTVVSSYKYDGIGQMTDETGERKKSADYDVAGKVMKVYSDAERKNPVVAFTYDDRGFRLNKTTYDKTGSESHRTWYVRDLSGNVAGTYEEDLEEPSLPRLTELPVYATGRIGLYKPDYGFTLYEINDHLGNVRAVIGDKLEVEYLATMESERANQEDQLKGGDFENVKSVPTAGYINYTPNQVKVSGAVVNIAEPNEVNRLNNNPAGQGDANTSPIGTGKMLWVHPGDVIKAEVYVKYANFDDGNKQVVLGLSNFLASAFGTAPTGIDIPGIFSVVDDPAFALQGAWAKLDDEQPRAFLTYLLFDNNFKLQKNGFDFAQVSEKARIIGAGIRDHERLAVEVTVQKEGFMYVYVSNLSDQNMDVYFDDLRITQTYSNIVAGGDYYPFGLAIKDRQIEREFYRYGYQGQYAERDDETGWNHFELREYDPVIGRWVAKDPKKQYYSPYLSMGNNPINSVDADGGDDVYFNKDGSYNRTEDTNWFVDTFIGHRGYIEGKDGEFTRVYFNDEKDALLFGGEKPTYDGLKMGDDTYVNGLLEPRINRFSEFRSGRKTHIYEDIAITSGPMGALDFGGESPVNKLVLYGGRAYNQKDFGNFLWGAAMQVLNVSFPSSKLGSEFNGFWNGKAQNGQWSQISQSTWDRITLRGDSPEDQNAIRNGYTWGIRNKGLKKIQGY